ncbi:ABC transporter ATP-binding protein [Desulfobacula sp.]|uniref:ABC transporter ATP-binding protein n=1 Tax=Desulfobacula sp. TaxID=2593537 RepID=UPI0026068C47|nr:ABC transporter ATP-binding protein [Desulfobacula sp.]
MLKIKNLSKRFGGIQAVTELDIDIKERQIFGLIGPNGAGKSTTLNMIDGSLFPTTGTIIFKEENITHQRPCSRAGKGIARVFQKDVLFSSFSARENIKLGLHLHSNLGLKEIFFPWSAISKKKDRILDEKAMEILKFVRLGEKADEMAINLPHGNQRALGLGIAMATGCDMLLLDEPLTGMNAQETDQMMEMITTLRDEKNLTIVIVEHNIKAVLGLCDQVVVLDFGKKIAQGDPDMVVEMPNVIEAWLGAEQDAV